jgi:hypothetical protein
MRANYADEFGPIVDPTLSPRMQRRIRRLVRRATHPGDKLPVERVGPLAFAVCLLGWFVSGLAAPWFAATVVAVIAWLAIRREVPWGALARYRDRYVDPSTLAMACWRPLRATQCAIDEVLGSEVYRDGSLADAARAAGLDTARGPDLWRHRWEIAWRLREITRLSDEHTASTSAGVPGPHTAKVLSAHRRAVEIALEATERRVAELQQYAAAVRAADAALRDRRMAEQMADRNDRYLDLVASTEADEYAIAEIRDMASEARLAFEATLSEATLAAQPLVLPDRPGPPPEEII